MTQEEKAQLASELLKVRQEMGDVYQKSYNAFVEAILTFSNILKPILAEQMDLVRRIARLELAMYKKFKEEDTQE